MKRLEEFLDTFPEFFIVAHVLLDPPHSTGIKFVPCIENDLWKEVRNWVYLIVIAGKIVKIGGTEVGMRRRTYSYRTGNKKSRNKGTCSTTNHKCVEYMKAALKNHQSVYIYGEPLKKVFCDIADLNVNQKILVCTFKTVENALLEEFALKEKKYPVLSDVSNKPQYV